VSEVAIQLWPFPVPPPEQRTPHERESIRFLEEAAASGFRAGKLLGVTGMEYFAEGSNGRRGDVDYRGRNRWEVGLFDAHGRVHAFWTDDFGPAVAAVLAWLRGGTAADVLATVEGHVIRGKVTTESTERIPS
jgi:hypothetical protein